MHSAEADFYLSVVPTWTDTGAARIAHRRFGDGGGGGAGAGAGNDPLLFIHGWPFSGFIWRKLLPRLAARHACITVDLPGAGYSTWTDRNDFSFHGHADNLKRLVSELGLSSYRLIAHDTGATVARRLAVIDPDRARGLVLIDTEIPHQRPPLVPLLQKVMMLPGSAFAFRQLLRSRRFLRSKAGFGGCFMDLDLIDGEFHEQFIAPLVASPQKMRGQILYARGIDWNQLDGLATDHAKIRGPVLLIWGDRDRFFPIDQARAMIPQFRDCRGLVEIPGTRLLPFEEKPDVVLPHIEKFLA